ncbi:hypothetical protein C451_19933 [Halococcus thailandensis JCM 13552]|uniref:Uncharacterized protein n=1 Tax=Halococcus thailandensis JCM 13552 TaxID=1227457 RepID=M0MW57_9EURY|nr:hypothetical protein C451_19933 [Halococcus thailandensis JCM 13552]
MRVTPRRVHLQVGMGDSSRAVVVAGRSSLIASETLVVGQVTQGATSMTGSTTRERWGTQFETMEEVSLQELPEQLLASSVGLLRKVQVVQIRIRHDRMWEVGPHLPQMILLVKLPTKTHAEMLTDSQIIVEGAIEPV